MTETPTGPTPPPRGPRRLIWGLGTALVVVLVALAGAVGYIVADSRAGESAAPVAAVSNTATAPAETPTSTFALPTQTKKRDLRATVEAMTEDGNAIVASGDPDGFKLLLRDYATPECEALILGMLAAFGDEGTSDDVDGTSTIVSVVENEDTGTAVLRDDLTGEEEHEDWVRGNDGWRMTCELGFGNEEADAPVEVETTTAEPTAVKDGPCAIRGETADNNNLICVQGVWVGVAYPNVTPGSACPMDNTEGIDINGDFVMCTNGRWRAS